MSVSIIDRILAWPRTHQNTSLLLAGFGLGLIFSNRQEICSTIKQSISLFSSKNSQTKFIQQSELNKHINLTDDEYKQLAKKIFIKYLKEFEESKVLEQIIERKISTESPIGKLVKDFEHTSDDIEQKDLALCNPIWDMLSRGGKRIRPIICALIAESFGNTFQDLIEIAGFIEVLHNSSLIIDDIEDNSSLRREKEAIHILYGTGLSINAGNYAYFAPLHYLLGCGKFDETKKMRLAKIYAEEMTSIHFGQAWDLLWQNLDRKVENIPSESRYLQMIVHKTGVLFRMMARMASVVLELPTTIELSLSKFTEKIGAAFQIQDDVINLDSPEYKSKGICGEDIYEGKITLMIVHSIACISVEKKSRLLEIIGLKTKDEQLINEAIQIMRDSGSLEYARKMAERLMNEAWQELHSTLPENQAKYDLLLICQFVTKRSH